MSLILSLFETLEYLFDENKCQTNQMTVKINPRKRKSPDAAFASLTLPGSKWIIPRNAPHKIKPNPIIASNFFILKMLAKILTQ